jgi:hypothetical protein
MKMRIVVILLMILIISRLAANEISLNFFIHPQFEVNDLEALASELRQATMDSCMSLNIYAGEIILPAANDSLIMQYLHNLPGILFSPNDFLHHHKLRFPSFGLLAANIASDSVTTLKKFTIKNDSIRIGIFTIYTPDLAVKKQFAPGVNFDANVFKIAKEQAHLLREAGCDHIILLTSLSRAVIYHLQKEIDLDSIISFDYITEKNSPLELSEGTKYYSFSSKNGKFGRLKISLENTEIKTDWQEIYWGDASRNR